MTKPNPDLKIAMQLPDKWKILNVDSCGEAAARAKIWV